MKTRSFLTAVLLGVVFLGLVTSPGFADDGQPVTDDEVNQVASQLYCPICENIPLDVCPTQACADWRELIRGFLADGKSDAEIKDYFSTQYGWNVLAVPPREGLNWVIYALPPAIILAGIVAVVLIIRRSKPVAGQTVDVPETAGAVQFSKYQELIDRDLKKDDAND